MSPEDLLMCHLVSLQNSEYLDIELQQTNVSERSITWQIWYSKSQGVAVCCYRKCDDYPHVIFVALDVNYLHSAE